VYYSIVSDNIVEHQCRRNSAQRRDCRDDIVANHQDSDDAATPGPTGINVFGVSPIEGTIISQNVIKDEAVQIAVNASPRRDTSE
jgi:hypothetical protein